MALYHFKQNRTPQFDTDSHQNYEPQNYCLKDLKRIKENERISSFYSAKTSDTIDRLHDSKSNSVKTCHEHCNKPVLLASVDLGSVMVQTVLEEMRLLRLEQEETLRRLSGC